MALGYWSAIRSVDDYWPPGGPAGGLNSGIVTELAALIPSRRNTIDTVLTKM